MKPLNFLIIIFYCLGLSSCVTAGVAIDDVNSSASDIRKAFVIVLGEPRSTSANGRELESRYHDSKGNIENNSEQDRVRRYTKIVIYGDRRPFQVVVRVAVEQKNLDKSYEELDPDEGLSHVMAERIKKALHQSLENRNAIDDFRAF
jgi:hypothetical protein